MKGAYIDEYYVLYNQCIDISGELLKVTDSSLLEMESKLLLCSSPNPNPNPNINRNAVKKEYVSIIQLYTLCMEYSDPGSNWAIEHATEYAAILFDDVHYTGE